MRGDSNYELDEASRQDEIGEIGRVYAQFRTVALERSKAEKAAEELESQRLAAAIAAGEIPPPEGEMLETVTEQQLEASLSPTVLAAEEIEDGRVRVAKSKRRGVEGKGRPRKGEQADGGGGLPGTDAV